MIQLKNISATLLVLTLFLFKAKAQTVSFARFENNPIITPESLPGPDGEDINGPSLIKVPDWVPNKLGTYYLYFAHHKGKYIHLGYADNLKGPWKIYKPGTQNMALP